MSDLPAHLRDVIPTGWQFTMWPYMQEYPDGTQRDVGTHYTLSTIHQGRKVGYRIMIDHIVRGEPWFHEYEADRVSCMVKSIIWEVSSKEVGGG